MSKMHSRLDAAQSAFVQRQLESIDGTDYTELVPGALGRNFLPLVSDVAEWQNVYTYYMWRLQGGAKVGAGAGNGDNLPRASVQKMGPFSRAVKSIENSYGWTVDEIQRAAGTGTPLDTMSVLAARTATEREVDDLLAVGNSSLNIEGLLSLADVTLTSPTTGNWAAATPDQIITDINKPVIEMQAALKQANNVPGFNRWTVLMPVEQYGYLATRPRSSTSDTTILKFILQTSPWIEAIEPWYQCNGAGAAVPGTTDRAVYYPRNPLWGGALIPRDFKAATAPQERGLEVIVPTHASCGGVICRYPVAARYMDGI
jgi:hypothetical protein